MPITKPEESIIKEIEEQRPSYPVGILSRQERDLLIERGARSLYRWYTTRSQKTRSWHPDHSFNWRALRTDHSPEVNTVIEGVYGIENYAPDYTTRATHMLRKSYGRANFQLRWGAEEEKHSDLWLNCMLFMRFRTPEWIEDYMHYLRNGEWQAPWEDPLHLAMYVVIQERATQLTYLNIALFARGESDKPGFEGAADPELVKIAQTIAIDEAAHYNFFPGNCAPLFILLSRPDAGCLGRYHQTLRYAGVAPSSGWGQIYGDDVPRRHLWRARVCNRCAQDCSQAPRRK